MMWLDIDKGKISLEREEEKTKTRLRGREEKGFAITSIGFIKGLQSGQVKEASALQSETVPADLY